MKKSIPFHKMHGLGNDFVVIDATKQPLDMNTLPVTLMADRHLGIGFDQLLIIENSNHADYYCRILNADGSEAEQCGNGLRAVARYIHEQGLLGQKEFRLETIAGIFPVLIKDYDHIRITMTQSASNASQLEVPLPEHNKTIQGSTLSMGNPHFIIPVDDLNDTAPMELGSLISTHPVFPQGTNVGFMQVVTRQHIRLKTIERGAGETLACGSNACAAVLTGIQQGALEPHVAVEFQHGQVTVEWEGHSKPVYMTGPAADAFRGEWPLSIK